MRDFELILLNSSLKFFPSFGNFDYSDKFKRGTDSLKDFDEDDVKGTESANILQFLIDEGFVSVRKDIDEYGKIIQLSDIGRKLKDSGSYQKYQINVDNKKREKNFRNQMAEASFWVNCLIALATLVAAIYYGIEIWKYFFYDCH